MNRPYGIPIPRFLGDKLHGNDGKANLGTFYEATKN